MTAPSAPPGWYPNPDPSGDGKRYWDGEQWSSPPPPAPDARTISQHAPGSRPDPTLAWMIALAPLGVPVVALLMPAWAPYAGFVALSVMLQCASSDSKRLAKHGIKVSWWWAWLIGVAYLIARAKATNSTIAIPVVGGLAVGASLLLGITLASVYTYPEQQAEDAIEDWLEDQGIPRARVDCAGDVVGNPGDTTTCDAWLGGQQRVVTVTVEEDGYISWELG